MYIRLGSLLSWAMDTLPVVNTEDGKSLKLLELTDDGISTDEDDTGTITETDSEIYNLLEEAGNEESSSKFFSCVDDPNTVEDRLDSNISFELKLKCCESSEESFGPSLSVLNKGITPVFENAIDDFDIVVV